MVYGVKIAIISKEIPRKKLNNYEISMMTEKTSEWIVEKIGIKERRIASIDETTSSLAIKSIKKIIDLRKANEIECLICSTVSPDYLYHPTSLTIKNELNLVNALVFDIRSGCSSSIHALNIGIKMIKSGMKKVIVTSSELISRSTNANSGEMMSFFGDGAVSILLERCDIENDQYDSSYLSADESIYEFLLRKDGGSKNPINKFNYNYEDYCWNMNGYQIKQYALASIDKMLNIANVDVSRDHFLFHQANFNLIKKACVNNGIDINNTTNTIKGFGNMGGTSLFLTLYKYLYYKKHSKKIHLLSFGAGGNYGFISLKNLNDIKILGGNLND